MSDLIYFSVFGFSLIFALFLIIAYFSGSVPFGYIISRWKGVPDIRETGSGSTGGTNVSRKLGLGWGIFVGFLDGLKSFLPTLLALEIFGKVNLVIVFLFGFISGAGKEWHRQWEDCCLLSLIPSCWLDSLSG
jgi:acyl-phosphate glycerol 3-phosphate acyltransferase